VTPDALSSSFVGATRYGNGAVVISHAATQLVASGGSATLQVGTSRTITVTLQDDAEVTVQTGTDATRSVALSAASGTASLSGLGSVTAVAGIATFTVTPTTTGTITLQAAYGTMTDTISFTVEKVLTVSYDSGGGSSIAATLTTNVGTVADPGVPTLAGYTFAGWYTAASGGSAITFPYTHGRTDDFTAYARWTANTLAVNYDSGGGSSIAATSTTTGGTVTDPGTPTRAGYTFDGWYTSVSGGALVTWPYTHGRTDDFTVYARWSKILAVSYDSGGGSSVTATSTTTGGTVADPGAPTLAGYTFDGWYTAASGGSAITFPYTHGRTSDFTLFARWSQTLAVSYDSGGGSSIADTSTSVGGTVVDPGVPTLAGYTFAGWYTAASGGSLVTWPYTHRETSDFVLYARWTANTLAVTLDSQGGSSISDVSTTTDGTVADPGAPTRAGYAFVGWRAASGASVTYPYTHGETTDFTLYARWTLWLSR
jgi:uncharacterized repeat protein (TIGR02543 family)